MKSFSIKKFKLRDLLIGGVSVFVIMMCVSIASVKITDRKIKVIEEEFIETPCYKDSIANILNELKVKYPHIVLAQSILESGNYSSAIFVENNNPFGMKLAKNRPTTALGIRRGHAYYSSIREAVIDYAFMQASYYRSAKSEEEYFNLLQKSYAEDKDYINKLKKLSANYGN